MAWAGAGAEIMDKVGAGDENKTMWKSHLFPLLWKLG